MICARCHTPNPTSAENCLRCGSGLFSLEDGATIEVTTTAVFPSKPDFGPRYEVLSVLGSGGMGKVYKALDKELDRTVALKVLRPDLMAEPLALQRFKQELLLASSISHPNILRIHDLGEYNAIKFISMVYVDGGDLTDVIKKEGRLPVERAVNIMKQLCDALAAAHSANVVHRDLKPQNILLDREDHVYVSDFGVAKSLESDRTNVTRTGAVLGTPLYMSPEQVEGKPVDHRSDLYSLGLIFYEMLTGILPFSGDSTFQLMYQRVHQVPRKPELVTPGLPSYLSRICLRCLEKDPAMRYQSAGEILEDLELRHSTAHTRTLQITVPVFTRKHWGLLALALVVLLAGPLSIPQVRHWLFAPKAAEPVSGIPPLKQGKFVAVLPIRVLGNDPSLNYVADGLGEALSAKLFQLRDVHTTSAADVQKLRSVNSIQDVAHQLGVNLVVTGTIQGSGDKLRVVISLDNAANNKRVWTQDFNGLQQDLLTMEDQIYGRVVDALALKPSNEENARASSHPTENIEAYDLYLKGRDALRGQDVKNAQSAISLFEQALQKDRSFALAYAGVADASLLMYRETKNGFWSAKALAAAQQAAALNQNQPEILIALGSVYNSTGRSMEAIAELKHALEVAPNSDEAYRRLGSAYFGSGRSAEALQSFQKAIEINPYYWVNYIALGNAHYQVAQYLKAADAYRKVVELDPNNPSAYNNLGAVLLQSGKFAEAVDPLKKSLQFTADGQAYSNLGVAYFYQKRYDEAIAAYAKAVELVPNSDMFMGNLAEAYYLAGQKDRGLSTFEQAIALAYKTLQVNPRDASVKGRLALWYGKKGDVRQALKFINEARAIDPNDVDLIYYQAQAFALSGDKPKAIAALREAFKKGQPPPIAQAEPDLQSLQGDPAFESLVKEFTGEN